MYEKFYSRGMGGDLYRLQRSTFDKSDSISVANSGIALSTVAEKPKSVIDALSQDDVLILGVMLLLLSEKQDSDIIILLAMLLLN